PRQPSHEVELRWERVPDLDGIQPNPSLRRHGDDLAGDALRDGIVNRGLERDVVEPDAERSHPLVLLEPREVRHERLHHERPARFETASHTGEAPYLSLLREQREDRVEHDVDEVEPPLHGDALEVAHRHWDPAPARLPAEPGHHLLRGVDAVDPDALLGQGKSHPARPDAELQGAAAADDPEQERHGFDRVASEPWLEPLVVDVRPPAAVRVGSVRRTHRPRAGRSYTETWNTLADVNGSWCQPPYRSRSRRPATRAIRSLSDGHTDRMANRYSRRPLGVRTTCCPIRCCLSASWRKSSIWTRPTSTPHASVR